MPALRGKESDRRPGDILAEVEALVAEGVRRSPCSARTSTPTAWSSATGSAFAKLLRACGEIEGLERVRFTSPHPSDFTDDVIAAMAETPNVMPQLHMPLQSGSDAMLRAMRRSYRSREYLGIIDRVRAAMPDAAITTDIIVGFPGETEDDFQATLDVVAAARFAARSPSSTPSAPAPRPPTMDDQVPPTSCRNATSGSSTWWTRSPGRRTRSWSAARVEVLVAEGEGRKDAATHRMSGRGPDNRLVHFCRRPGPTCAPATWSRVEITYAAPHHLIADGRSWTYGAPAPATPGRRGRRPPWLRGRAGHAHRRRTRAPAGRARLRLTHQYLGVR